MHVYLILVMLCEVFANYEPESDSPNVGSVLFKHADVNCKRWKRTNIELLLARKIFQELIPPPYLMQSINEDYITNLLEYLQNSYSTVKREIQNPVTHKIMNIALSDAIGGYLKIWVLPITKYAFYGGSVSLDKATSIFQVYEDIKSQLKTNGSGWRSPNEHLLNSVAINIGTQPQNSCTRSMKDSCKLLSFYEKTDSGLTVPLPVIHWGTDPVILFVPLKNQSLVQLTSPMSSKILLKYYDVAKNCLQSQNPERLDNFNQRFQTWIDSDISPHLNDDKLYLGFDSILTLTNKTKKFCGKISDVFDDKYSHIRFKAALLGMPLNWTSKKYLILFIILLVEIIWCVPTLICLICSRRKRSKLCRNLFKRKPDYRFAKFCEIHKEAKDDNAKREKGSRGVKLFVKPRTRNLKFDVQFPPYDSALAKSSSSQTHYKTTSSEKITVVNETSLKKILPEFDSAKVDNQKKEFSKIDKAKKGNAIRERSLISDKIVKATETLTLIKDSERTIKQFQYSDEKITSKTSNICGNICKRNLASGSKDENIDPSSSAPCNEKNDQKQEMKRVTYTEPQMTFGKIKRKEKTQCKSIIRTLVDTKSQIKETIMETSNINVKSGISAKVTTDKPLLRIKIDRPKTEIKVGISSYRKSSELKKPSKIPRLAIKETKTDMVTETGAGPSAETVRARKMNTSKNIKRNSQDDSAIRRSSKDKKINITL